MTDQEAGTSSLLVLWQHVLRRRTISIIASTIVVALGVLLIAVGEVGDWGWTRLVGAGIISIAATGVGVLIGWSDPIRPRIAVIFRSWRNTIIAVLALIIVGPVLIGLLLLPAGAIIGGAGVEWYLVLAGVLITIFLLALTLIGIGAAIQQILEAETASAAGDTVASNGQDVT